MVRLRRSHLRLTSLGENFLKISKLFWIHQLSKVEREKVVELDHSIQMTPIGGFKGESLSMKMFFHPLAGTGRRSCCSHGKHQQRRLIYGAWVASWRSSYVEELYSPDVIVSFHQFRSSVERSLSWRSEPPNMSNLTFELRLSDNTSSWTLFSRL